MRNKTNIYYTPLAEPIPITEHQWDDDVAQFVSISCTTYNHEPYIRDAIEGFLMQKTTFPVRIVIFEDCSTDNTAAIIKEYAAKYPNLFRAFCQSENTYNKPIRHEVGRPFREERAKAKYIALCEGDDYWTDPLKLQKQVNFLEENPDYSLCVSGYKTNFGVEKISIPKNVKTEKNGYTFTLNNTTNSWLTKTLTSVYRSNADVFNSFSKYKYRRDVHLFYHILKTGKGFYFTSIMGVYNKHEGGINSMKSTKVKANIAYKVYKELYLFNKDEWTRIMYFKHSVNLLRYNLNINRNGSSFFENFKLFFETLFLVRNSKEIKMFLKIFLPINKQKLINA